MDTITLLAGKTVASYTLGCKLNFAETASAVEALEALGMRQCTKDEEADVCIVNTCSVTEVADSKSRQAVRKLIRRHPKALVCVMGCFAQLRPQQVAAIEGVHLILGAEEKGQLTQRIVDLLVKETCNEPLAITSRTADIRSFAPSCSCGNRTRYFLKVQDGCDYFCTYCTIPLARGRSRNASVRSLVDQARDVASKGGREIVITGVNIGDFGRTTGEAFIDLIRELDKVEGIERYRISSIEPNLLSDEILEFCAQSRAFMPHFHLPLQSGSDDVLRLMHRHYDTNLFAQRVKRIRELMPDAFIGVDVIVGTRGETADLFDRSLAFMQEVDVSQYHVFSYSERPGTAALRIDHSVGADEKHQRSQQVIALSEQKLSAFYNRFLGQVRPVLIEHGTRRGGFTDNYIKVSTKGGKDNHIERVRLEAWGATKDHLKGCVV